MIGPTAPAMVAPEAKPGKELRGRTIAGLALELLSIALPQLGAMSDEGQAVAGVIKTLGSKFSRPPRDLGEAEMKFMQSQLYPVPRPGAMDSGPDIRSRLSSMGVGAGSPPPAGLTMPPGMPPGGMPPGGAPPSGIPPGGMPPVVRPPMGG